MKTTDQGPNDDKDLKEIAEFVADYMKYAEKVFFEEHIENVKKGGISRNAIKLEGFKNKLDDWLKNNSLDKGELVKALTLKLKENSAALMYESFNELLNTEKEKEKTKLTSFDKEESDAFKATIAENEYVKRGKNLKKSLKDSNVVLVCEVLARVCESFDMIETDNFFRRAAKALKERVSSYRQTKILELTKLSPDALDAVNIIRSRASSQSVLPVGSKTTGTIVINTGLKQKRSNTI